MSKPKSHVQMQIYRYLWRSDEQYVFPMMDVHVAFETGFKRSSPFPPHISQIIGSAERRCHVGPLVAPGDGRPDDRHGTLQAPLHGRHRRDTWEAPPF